MNELLMIIVQKKKKLLFRIPNIRTVGFDVLNWSAVTGFIISDGLLQWAIVEITDHPLSFLLYKNSWKKSISLINQ